jgi:hypothetical protein
MEPRASYTSRPRSARPHPTLHIPTLFLPPRPYLLPTSPPSPMSLTCSPAPSPRSQVALWRHESQSSGKPWKVSTFLLPFSTWLFAFPSSPPVRIWSPRSKLFPTPSSSCTCRQHQQARIQSGRVYLPSMFHRLRQATMARRRLLADVPPVHRHRQGAPPSDPLVVGTPDPAARAKPAAPRRGSWGPEQRMPPSSLPRSTSTPRGRRRSRSGRPCRLRSRTGLVARRLPGRAGLRRRLVGSGPPRRHQR